MSVRAVLTRCDFPWSQFITGWTYHSCESSLSSGCYILCGSLLWRRHVSFSSCYCTIVSKEFSAAQHSTIFIIKTLCQQTNVRLKFFSRRLLLTHTTSRPYFKNNNNNNNNKKCVCPLESGFYYMIACCCLLCETFFSKVVALGLLLRFIHRDHRLNRIGNIWNKCRPYDDVPISIWIEFEFVLQQTGSGRNLMLCTATAQHFRQYCRKRVRINLIQFDFNWISLERNAPSHRQRVKWNLLLHSIQSTTNNFNRFAELNNSTDECIIWWFQLPIVHSTLYTTDNGILLTFIPQIKYFPCVVLFEQKIQPFLTPESNNPICTLDIYHPRNIYIVAGIPLLPAVCV